MPQISMEEIAKLAGVSVATVSRVIHTPQLVSPKTRDRVRLVLKKHQYVYNAAAADLSRQKTKVIGLLIPTTRSPVFASTVLAIQEFCQELGYAVIVGNTKYEASIEQDLIRQFRERRVAGIILTGFTLGQENLLAELNASGVPTVVIWEKLDDGALSYVGFDNYRSAYDMTEYLLDLGHRRLGIILGPFSKVGRVRKRWEGIRDALAAKGLDMEPDLVHETEPTLKNGYKAMGKLLSLPKRPTAVFAVSDVLAIGALRAAREAGLSVPEDISVAGHDDIGIAAFACPPLTTVKVKSYKIGRLAVENLLELIDDDQALVRRHCLETSLVIRESCAPVKKRTGRRTGERR